MSEAGIHPGVLAIIDGVDWSRGAVAGPRGKEAVMADHHQHVAEQGLDVPR